MGILDNRVAIVSGGGRGIGRATAILLAQEGARVTINDIGVSPDGTRSDRAPADEVVEIIRSEGGGAVAAYEDVSQIEAGERLVQRTLDEFGRVDVVFTPQGILRDRAIFNMSEDEWDAVVGAHLKGTFSVLRPASMVMRQQQYGRIITVVSIGQAIRGTFGTANYSAAKGGILGLTKTASIDLAKYNVTANMISPRAGTRLYEGLPDHSRPDASTMGEPEDIAPLVTYLASEEAGWVTGEIFEITGGYIGRYPMFWPIHSMWKPGRWTTAELGTMIKPNLFPQPNTDPIARIVET